MYKSNVNVPIDDRPKNRKIDAYLCSSDLYSIILYKSEYGTEMNANHMNVGYRSVTNAMSSLIIRIFVSNSRSFYISANESHTHTFEPVGHHDASCNGHCPFLRSQNSTHFYFWQFNFFRVTDTCQLKVERRKKKPKSA